jgi:hypothetical protein
MARIPHLRMRRWRWFFLATAGLFGYADGSEWGFSHYRMKACLNKSQSLRSCFFPSPIVGEGGFAKRRRARGLSPRMQTPHPARTASAPPSPPRGEGKERSRHFPSGFTSFTSSA